MVCGTWWKRVMQLRWTVAIYICVEIKCALHLIKTLVT